MTFDKNMTAVRWFSVDNNWMDFIVVCDRSMAEKCRETINTAMDEWFDFAGDDGWCYGNYVEEKLMELFGNDYDWFIIYHNDEDGYDEEYEAGMDNLYDAFHYFD